MPVHDASARTTRTGYTFLQQGNAASANSSGAMLGKHVLRRVPGVDYWSPAWGEETVIRIFPALNPDDPKEFDAYRLSQRPCDFGDWIRAYEAVRNFGQPGVTMLLHNGLDQSYDAQLMNPCWILYRAVSQALNQGQGMAEWVPLMRGAPGKGAVLSRPSKVYLVQCAIFRHKSKDTFGPGKPPLGAASDGPTIVMGLPPTAGENLIRLIEEKTEDWKGDPSDVAQYKYGDIISPESGAFVHIYELGKDPRARFNTSRQATNPMSIYQSSAAGSKQSMEAKGYGVFLTSTLDGNPNDIPAALTGIEDMVKAKFKPWKDILEFKTDEEQARLIAPLFPPSAVLYAWREHPSWIPESVRDAGAFESRKPVSAPVAPSFASQHNPWAKAKPAVELPAAPEYSEDYSRDAQAEYEATQEDMTQIPLPELEAPAVIPTKEESDKVRAARAKLNEANKRVSRG